jgi:hypothetical protein
VDYELAKQLKDAGFHQAGQGRRLGPSNALTWRAHELVYVPTLEELIDACGDTKLTLYRVHPLHPEKRWATSYEHKPCKTPLEAMARTWLALRKDKQV